VARLMAWTVKTAVLLSFAFSIALASELKPKILMVSPEQRGIYQTGGLAHATADLATSLIAEGYKVEVMMPFYFEMDAKNAQETGERLSVTLYRAPGSSHRKVEFSVLKYQNGSNPTIFIRHDGTPTEMNYFDNRKTPEVGKAYTYAPEPLEAFGILAKAQADYILSKDYDIVILNDWTAGLIALHLKLAKDKGKKTPKVIFAIHNIAYQGAFAKTLGTLLGLDPKLFSRQIYNFFGQSFLKTGIEYSDMVYTVSPRYAKEISTPRFGAGLEGLIKERWRKNRMTGILNGIVNSQWDPSIPKDTRAWTFNEKDLTGKAKGKEFLQQSLGLPVASDIPLFVLTSRLAEQKGFVYLLPAIEEMLKKSNAQWIIIGDGERETIEQIEKLQKQFPKQIHYSPFSNQMEKQLMRYGDFFVNGAWFEPSGLNQFFALKNATLPVVSLTGGLADSVKDGVNGLTFPIISGPQSKSYDKKLTAQEAIRAFERALLLYGDKEKLQQMRLQAMSEDHSWNQRIRTHYSHLFQYVLEDRSLYLPFAEYLKSSSRTCSRVHNLRGLQ